MSKEVVLKVLELIFKKIIKNKVPSILKSYHLLTLFFWFMELDAKVSSWDDDSVEAFVRNLEAFTLFVIDRLRNKNIPHYYKHCQYRIGLGSSRAQEEMSQII